MADQIELKVPDVGGEEVEVIEILVSKGDTVEQEDGIVTVESDKASMDIPASSGGKIAELKVKVGDTISEGDVLAIVEAAGDSDSSDDEEEKEDEKSEEKEDKSDDKDEEKASESKDEDKEEKKESSEPKKSSGESKVIDVEVPDIGDEEDVEIIEILVSKGDSVSAEDGLITLETDKATMDVPCPEDGEIEEMLVNVGDKVSQGSVIAKLKVSGGADDSEAEEDDSAKEEKSESGKESDKKSDDKDQDKGKDSGSSTKPSSERQPPVPDHPSQRSDRKEGILHASPAVRRVAREFGVDLSQVKGSGPKDRILKEDVQDFVKYELSRPKAVAGATGQGGGGLQVIDPPKVDFSKFGEVEEVQLSRIQRKSGPNLHRNWVTIPHVTQFDEADITELENFRKSENEVAKKKDLGFKITPLVFILKACAKALREFPTFNSSLSESGESLYMKKYVHIGIAVDTPNGLVVPVIRDVDQKGIYELSEELVEISTKARDGKLKATDMQGGCFSISSLGGIGGTAFTPIVNAPDVAILGVSRNEMKPKWNGKEFEPRLTLPLSLSYDHRVIDGAEAARFTAYLSGVLGDIRKLVL
ncbi:MULTISPECIES: dihydrolipoyllysine-residue acetyltransferase [Idiomarina]|jgi:pyruvate dehydrogenase E2 component (dihydrolipoamide acetyltransferase)|uniref:Acetyltransferase component of pyruvate dehydrogenase complex n=3 Tax=Idiomarina abyssalis TaxID=86102 RepID=A0A8I1G9D5_9GAMM|nr:MULTISPECIES: dihydrolipoyllysine-residue acetyltransferase [Idiomarina]KPD21340.1 dihydrolipoamide acetyltransferase [Idiomarina abyssalis]MAO68626.1 dihydrolipoyllysine-residue acetyltransferase [Idiomarina sp.]MBF81224.1 dihydrolipoyllysine-residue acetyltransferase [Idiomarina sp.]MBJ7265778.1 dihydrolipoyllysine-residue acetyltransferase [Idiomarina abyssalis]MBJ7273205.1 dihydrolipoyllysine-residue acetyltransferase [Idiomarina abyssalis]|tara:strand:- start:1516 stop:3279 length:1764 start_codon:yes stop_codon:yes gene_type:complete